MNRPRNLNRRQFIARTTGAFALTASASASGIQELIRLGWDVVRRFSFSSRGEFALAMDQGVQILGSDGRVRQFWKAGEKPHALAHDPNDGLYLAIEERGGRCLKSGIKFLPAKFGPDASITDIAPTRDDSAFVADSGNRVIWKLSSAGRVVNRITSEGRSFRVSKTAFPIYWTGSRLLVGETASHRVLELDGEGNRIRSWGNKNRRANGFSGCCNPVARACNADGEVITAERGILWLGPTFWPIPYETVSGGFGLSIFFRFS